MAILFLPHYISYEPKVLRDGSRGKSMEKTASEHSFSLPGQGNPLETSLIFNANMMTHWTRSFKYSAAASLVLGGQI